MPHPVTHINRESLNRNPAFTHVVRVPAGYDTIYVGGRNGVGSGGCALRTGPVEQAWPVAATGDDRAPCG